MANQLVINYGAAPNDGTGDPLRDAFIKVDENFSNIWAAGAVGSNVTITNNTIAVTNTNGNLILSPNGIGVIQLNNSLVPRSNNVYNLGTANTIYRTIWARDLNLSGNLVGNFSFDIGGNINAGNFNTGGAVSAAGNVTGNYIIGDGSFLTNVTAITGSEIISGNSNVKIYGTGGNIGITVGNIANVLLISSTAVEPNVNIIPKTANSIDLGSGGNRFDQLYMSGNLNLANSSTVSANATAVMFENSQGGELVFNSTDPVIISGDVMSSRGTDNSNWNALTQIGVYQVNRASWSGVTGAPLDSPVYVGILQVSTSGNATAQLFVPGTTVNGNAAIQWNRSLSSGTWTDWYKIINNGQIIDAGSF